MNDNTILRIKVPAHLYESVKEQLSLTEAKKQNFGAGFSLVKEKKMKTPKDGMHKVEETKEVEMEKKTRTLDELKAAKDKLDKKIKQMEGVNENVEENINEGTDAEFAANNLMHSIAKGDPFTIGVSLVLGVAGAVLAGVNADKIKDTLSGWWKGLKDPAAKEKIKDFADENNVKLG